MIAVAGVLFVLAVLCMLRGATRAGTNASLVWTLAAIFFTAASVTLFLTLFGGR